MSAFADRGRTPERRNKGSIAVVASIAVVCLALIGVVFATGLPGSMQKTGVPLDPREALADTQDDGALASVANEYEPESIEKFADVISVKDADGNEIALDDVPADAYSGFLFEIADVSQGVGDVAAKLDEAVEQGLVKQVHGNLYTVDSLDTLAGLLDASQVNIIEPDFTMHLFDEPTMAEFGGMVMNPTPEWPPNDQSYIAGQQWNLDMLNIEGAWSAGLDGDVFVYNNAPVRDTPVKVAIIDTGLYGTGGDQPHHEDIDYTHVEPGRNFIEGTEGNAPDAKGHGTFVAGLIAAKVGNEKGIAGAMPGVTLVPEKVFDTGSASTSDVIGGIYHAVDDMGVDVINMSLGGEYNEKALETACDYAVEQGVLVVASAGNDGISTPNYPAAYDSVVGVASVNSSKQRSTWSQYGKSVFVTAPGESVTSTYIEGADSYHTGSGTSFSGPMVAALAAMCKSVYPDMDQATFKQYLIDTSEDLGAAGYDDYFGYGLVDFQSMAAAVLQSQVQPWYHITVNVVDSTGKAIEDAAVEIVAAEDISWDGDPTAEPSFDAGTLANGEAVDRGEDGAWDVHRGTYAYRVVRDGYYTAEGQFKTYTVDQTVTVNMQTGYETTVNAVDRNDVAVESAEIKVSSGKRVEEPKTTKSGSNVYDLASGAYTYDVSADGFARSQGGFTVQFGTAPTINAVLYADDELADVSFTYVDGETGDPVAGTVAVAVYDKHGVSITPESDGTFRLGMGCTYIARASKVGYEDTSLEFTVGDGEAETHDIVMARAHVAITFNVYTEEGDPVEGALVKVSDAAGNPTQAADGNPNRFYLGQGSYTYQVSAPGYESREGSFSVGVDSASLNIVLAAVPHIARFAVSDADTGAVVSGAAIKVSTDKDLRAIAPMSEGVWSLPPGNYRYTVYAEGYNVEQGTFSMSGSDIEVPVLLTRKAETDVEFAGGSGTEEDPYLIATEDQLRLLANQTEIVRMTGSNSSTSVKRILLGHYKLVADIELTGGEWLPIGNEENTSNYYRFGGTFDGDGHTVSGVYVNQPGLDAQGFFGSVQGATIRNLVVEGVVTGKSYVGGLVGRVHYSYSSQYESLNTAETTIERCGADVDVTGRYAVGGVVGSAQATNHDDDGFDVPVGKCGGIKLVECYSSGRIVGSENGDYAKANAIGGIVGSGQQTEVTSCYSHGSVDGGYNVGGLVGTSRRCTVSTSYNSGAVRQYAEGAGRAGTAGGLAGVSNNSLFTDSFYLRRDENTYDRSYGTVDQVSKFLNSSGKAFDDMYRSTAFVDAVNTNTSTSPATVGNAYRLGRDFPLFVWQVGSETVLAPAPRIIVQPEGIAARDAYKIGEVAEPLVAEAAEVESGTLTWAWYASATSDGANGVPVGATGTGTVATFVPPTDEVSSTYYYCVFSNEVSFDLESDTATTQTNVASVFVRSLVDAQEPVITKLNPSQTSDTNVSLTAKVGMDLELAVVAETADGGTLSYQWFSSNSEGGTPQAVEGATESTYVVDTSTVSTGYFYVEVTNTLEEGNISTVASNWITVDIRPYTIETYEDLAAFSTVVNNGVSFEGQTVYLLADVAIPDGVDWTPIGTPDAPFCGVFMGGSGYAGSDPSAISTHKVTGISIDGDAHGGEYLGLFGYTLAASIYDVQVQGEICGTNNVHAGLLAGFAAGSSASSGDASIENCGTLPGSSVEGKYDIGGLVGASGATIMNCANHADVHARSFTPTSADTQITARGRKAVGGLVGYAGAGVVSRSYNTGNVTVDSIGDGENCAFYVGGVAGFTSTYSGLASSFNSGALAVGTQAYSHYAYRGVLWSGSVAGLIASGNCANLHYIEGSYGCGSIDEYDNDYADYHSAAFMATDYFVNMLNTGSKSFTTEQFVKSNSGVPHLVWEDDDSVDDGSVHSAEPWLIDVQSADEPSITSKWKIVYYQSSVPQPIYVLAESADGGTLSFTWQKRSVPENGSIGDDDGWATIDGSSQKTVRKYAGSDYEAGMYTIDVSNVETAQYRCLVRNVVEGAPADEQPMESAIPAITIEVRSSENAIQLRDPSAENSASNPWVIDTPKRLKFFADVVNGRESIPGLASSSFEGQYVVLDADIDLSEYADWPGIGGDGNAFKGFFDGQNHAVTNMTVIGGESSPAEPIGLFGNASMASIRNLEVSGEVLTDAASLQRAAWSTAGVVGHAYGTFIENVVNRANVAGYNKVGGIVGFAENSKVLDCENIGDVTVNEAAAASKYEGYQVGGIVGSMRIGSAAQGSGAGVYNCLNAGHVTGRVPDSEYRSGAVVGEVDRDATVEVYNCYYLAGSITSVDGKDGLAGIGKKVKEPVADVDGTCASIDNIDNPEVAWLLGTSGGSKSNSGRWGNYARTDIGDQTDRVHLGRGDASLAIYKVDNASVAADIVATPSFAVAGQEVSVTWEAKPGFTVGEVRWVGTGGEEHAIGNGESSGTFVMPASDVSFNVEFEQNLETEYTVSTEVVYGATPMPEAASVKLSVASALVSQKVMFAIELADGYQVKNVSVLDAYGNMVAATRATGWNYQFAMPAASVKVLVELEDVGAPAERYAASLPVTDAAIHRYSGDATYRTGDLLYQAIAFSGSYFGTEKTYMAYQLEGELNAGLFEQEYSFSDGSTHRFTGTDVAKVIRMLGEDDIPADTPVAFECADGTVYSCTYGDLTALTYSSYDSEGAFTSRGLPVLLYFGVDGIPSTDGALGIVFGQQSHSDDNAEKLLSHVTRICVGDDVDYCQHVWGVYTDMDAICGGVADESKGQSKLTVRVYGQNVDSGEKRLESETVFTVAQIEQMAREDRGGIQRGYYSTAIYEGDEVEYSGPYTDYYEGYDLWKVLRAAGVPETAEGTVQFYQSGMNGLENSWKTVNVSLGYLAGNGPDGPGDYSNNVMVYEGEDGGYGPKSGMLTNVRPMIVYGKNSYPLVWYSGSPGVEPTAYNYRGPLMALLPQNATEGGNYVGSKTASSCYLALIDVYLPVESADYSALEAAVENADAALASGYEASEDGSDVERDKKWVPTDVASELESARSEAQSILDDKTASQDDVDAAVDRLNAAIESYLSSAKSGSKPKTDYVVPGTVIDPTPAAKKIAKPTASSFAYDGASHVAVSGGAGYTLSGVSKATNAGAYQAVAKLKSGYTWSDGSNVSLTLNWKITAASLSKASVSGLAAKTWTGSAIKPAPAVKVAGRTLKEGADYTVSYANNVKPGTATVTVKGKGNYAGSVSKTFKISPASVAKASVASVGSQAYTGRAVNPAPKVALGGRALKKGADYTLQYYNASKKAIAAGSVKAAGTYYVAAKGKGNYAGTTALRAFKVVAPSVSYRTHVQTHGWQRYVKDGAKAGTTGQAKRLEGMNVKLASKPVGGSIQYRTHIQRLGWEKGWKSDGAMSGTQGRSLRLEAMQVRLTGEMAKKYDVYYRVHAQHFGWMGWAKNGQSAGTAGYSYRLEAMQIKIVPKGAAAPGSTANCFRQKGK